mmetsp:Transcript_19713/g.27289  ORF Transcript_19713/g.27289 Transcript_19713/m.27289 type:complete len:93 (+) Transcript_19713:975-1253(+)
MSISQHGMGNNYTIIALIYMIVLVTILCYVPFFNTIFGTRQIAFPHFAVPSFSFIVIIITYDEIRKIFVREGTLSRYGKPLYNGWVVRNTYY